MRNYNLILRMALSAALASLTGQAAAVTTTSSFSVTATVLTTCSVSSTDLGFGNYDALAAQALDTTSTVSVQCTLSTGYSVGLNAGIGSGATVTTRKMTSTDSATLDYSLYQDNGRSVVWGESGAAAVTGTGTGAQVDHTVYGRIPTGQYVSPDTYSDTITVTVTF